MNVKNRTTAMHKESNNTDTDMNASVIRQFHQAKLVQLRLLPAISDTFIPQSVPWTAEMDRHQSKKCFFVGAEMFVLGTLPVREVLSAKAMEETAPFFSLTVQSNPFLVCSCFFVNTGQ